MAKSDSLIRDNIGYPELYCKNY